MIFYYTATGNSLYVARMIEENPRSIPQELKKENLFYRDETIGIVSPIYAGELPQSVRRFIQRAKFKAKYIYMVLTYGKVDSVAGVWSNQFCQKQGLHINYIHTILMVDNYLPSFDMNEELAIDKEIDKQLEYLKQDIQCRKNDIPLPTQEGQMLYETASQRFKEHPEFNNGQSIIIGEKCVGCSICQQVCPVGNILIENNHAKRISETCDFCLSCVQNCPFQAMGLKKEKNSKARYRNPNITLKDIVKSNKQGD